MQDLDIPLRPGRWWRRFLNQFELDHLMQQMTSEGQAEALAQAYLYFGDVEMVDRVARLLRRVDLKSVRGAARRYIPSIQCAYLGDTDLMRGAW